MCRPQGTEYVYVSNLIVSQVEIGAIVTLLYVS